MAIPALMMAVLFPVIGATAVFLLLRGHDLPGGGFVAGVTMAAAFILQYMARGTVWVEARLRILPMRWMGIGLLLAVGVGAAALLFDRPFLSSSFSYVQIPLIGAVPAASALLFDLGVFALVVGATVLMLIAIAHQSVRAHRTPSGSGSEVPSVPAKEAR
jgi:multicomponent K+:H+ antiporter subunit A